MALSLRFAIFVVAPLGLPAQPPSPSAPPSATTVTGIVSDSAGVGIAGANLALLGTAAQTYSDSAGVFRLAAASPGDYRLLVRRIGFRPETLAVAIAADRALEVQVRLDAAPQRIAPVVVAARSRYSGPLRGFNERRDRGNGHFFTAEDIARRNPRVVSDLLRTVPGTRINYVNGQNIITFRGLRCSPLLWVDGAPASAAYLDPDIFSVTSLAGIEVYPGPATVPAELTWLRGKSACGVIAVWTKLPEPRARPATRLSPEALAGLIESMRLYTADGVDTPAAADDAHPVSPMYPDSLFRAAVGGRVVVEFVVGIDGRPDMATFGAVLSTNPRFTEAVRQALGTARFTPAWLNGRRVRQLMQMPFTFEPSGSSGVR